jgi:DNA-binding MarR family transcriptional regulator
MYQSPDNMRNQKSAPGIPGPGEGKRGETGYLGYLLRQAAGAYRLKMERAMADLGVTPPQFSVLTMLAAYPGHSNADLARVAVLTPQTMSLIVANLERRGALVRHPHAVHGRIQKLELSKIGTKLLADCRVRAIGVEHDLSVDISAAEERTVRRWLVGIAVGNEKNETPDTRSKQREALRSG